MYIARIPNRNSRPARLLRESYREGGPVRTRTLAHLTNGPPERIAARERLVKGESDGGSGGDLTSGEIFGVRLALQHRAEPGGLTRGWGTAPESPLNRFLVRARIAHRGSRLSAVRGAGQHPVEDVRGRGPVDEDDLYAARDGRAGPQERIERERYQDSVKRQGQPPVWVRYEVTSSYCEGECNERSP